ncbi:hypothetical protein AB9P05_09800 [Roseivirga sp. BDSF3-8]|uniref:hypothetical protein n=1 Tax=Roseivirga sp. BDSF3-8 TaxID=3241598 RepID=UPI003531E188
MIRGVLTILLIVLIIPAWCSCDNKNYKEYESWDEDGDFVIDDKEFSSTYPESGLLNAWDHDADGRINRNEFSASSYDIWDADNDGVLEVNEWAAATNFYLNEKEYRKRGKFPYWDKDHDSIMQKSEFVAFYDSLQYFEEWDTDGDGELDMSELSSLLFKIYDIDEDGALQENEFSALNQGDEEKQRN